MELDLVGKAVVISGAASGIGRACAAAFAEEGARVGLVDIDTTSAAELVGALRKEYDA
ncbi:MAG: SDR family NAD(P)-dependent oxidoreductase, partial [Sciscionella sp.]